MAKRTDLAVEAHELWRESTGQTTKLSGVRASHTQTQGIGVDVVEILDRRGEAALGKPVGRYVTLELPKHQLREPSGFAAAAQALGRELAGMLPREGAVLVVGLGNASVTPDAIGPKALEHLVITRHLHTWLPQLRTVSAIAPGVLGTTGLESLEVVRGIVERAEPGCVVAVDALASRRLERVCATVQLTDTGIVPGAGIGNRRAAFSRETLGVPVLAVGVPTVIDAGTLIEDFLQENGCNTEKNVGSYDVSMVVTPKDIDAHVERISRLLGHGISLGLHPGLSPEEIACFVG